MTGMCPGPVVVNVGEGKLYALPALAGVILGTWLLGALHGRLTRPLGLVPVADEGPSAVPPDDSSTIPR